MENREREILEELKELRAYRKRAVKIRGRGIAVLCVGIAIMISATFFIGHEIFIPISGTGFTVCIGGLIWLLIFRVYTAISNVCPNCGLKMHTLECKFCPICGMNFHIDEEEQAK